MGDLEQAGEFVRSHWNSIARAMLAFEPTVPESKLADDCIFQRLKEIPYPWRIAIVNKMGTGRESVARVVFDIKPVNDRKQCSMVISCMACILRTYSSCYAVAVFDPSGQYGFAVRHQGADDMEIQDIFPSTEH
jgi:hypothetical protein